SKRFKRNINFATTLHGIGEITVSSLAETLFGNQHLAVSLLSTPPPRLISSSTPMKSSLIPVSFHRVLTLHKFYLVRSRATRSLDPRRVQQRISTALAWWRISCYPEETLVSIFAMAPNNLPSTRRTTGRLTRDSP